MISRSIRKNRRYTLRENLTGWVFLLPALAGFLFFFLLPIIAGVMFSFSDYTGFNLDSLQFVGLSNYQKMFSDDYFLQALRNNVVYALLFTPLTLILAPFFASLYFINGIYRRCLETDLQPHRRSLESPVGGHWDCGTSKMVDVLKLGALRGHHHFRLEELRLLHADPAGGHADNSQLSL